MRERAVSGNSVNSDENLIHEVTRRDIVDMLLLQDVPFHGRLDLIDFLKRIWPLDEMPSWDGRFTKATQDIATHMGFGDWDDSYLLTVRLGLLGEPDDVFLRFVEMAVHPMTQTDEAVASGAAAAISRHLRSDGYQLVETDRISGRQLFKAQPTTLLIRDRAPTPWENVDRQVAAMHAQFLRAESEEDYQAVGHYGREVTISLAQAVIDPTDATGEDGQQPSKTDARRLLEAFVAKRLPGGGNQALRKATRGVVQATSAVLHDRGATEQDAALIAELVSSTVHLVRILTTMPESS